MVIHTLYKYLNTLCLRVFQIKAVSILKSSRLYSLLLVKNTIYRKSAVILGSAVIYKGTKLVVI